MFSSRDHGCYTVVSTEQRECGPGQIRSGQVMGMGMDGIIPAACVEARRQRNEDGELLRVRSAEGAHPDQRGLRSFHPPPPPPSALLLLFSSIRQSEKESQAPNHLKLKEDYYSNIKPELPSHLWGGRTDRIAGQPGAIQNLFVGAKRPSQRPTGALPSRAGALQRWHCLDVSPDQQRQNRSTSPGSSFPLMHTLSRRLPEQAQQATPVLPGKSSRISHHARSLPRSTCTRFHLPSPFLAVRLRPCGLRKVYSPDPPVLGASITSPQPFGRRFRFPTFAAVSVAAISASHLRADDSKPALIAQRLRGMNH
ncbi:hypothetical protein S40288_10579 [Stachybotrys chartarum IBT 40288]|nr:hypothetical protein S40288_10579 [Stachybotrys chartarum IBT 40288]